MTPDQQLKSIYDELRSEGVCSTKREFAELLGVNYSTLINAMSGSPKYANEKIAARAEQLRKNVKTADPKKWAEPAPAAPRQGIVIPPETLELYNNLSRSVLQLSQTVDRLLAGETKKGGRVVWLPEGWIQKTHPRARQGWDILINHSNP